MKKIYYENQYIKNFIANIVNIKKCGIKYHVQLDKTAFFPGGGGQFCDLGFIGKERVVDVYEEDGVVFHVLENEPVNKKEVSCSLDWERRKDGMHQHLGQHVISGCFFKLFNANTVSFHLGKEVSTVDIIGTFNEAEIRKVELFANNIIEDGLNVQSLVPRKETLGNLGLRRSLPNTTEEIRVVKVGDLDINACCGVHPSSTLDLRLIKIKKWEKNKNQTRIEFLSGKRAIEDSLNKEKYLADICKYLNSNEKEALKRAKNMSNEIKEISDENKKLNNEMASYEATKIIGEGEEIGGFTIIKKIYTNRELKYINKVALKIVENKNTVVLIGNKKEGKANLIFAASNNLEIIGVNELLKEAITLINGKGGGSITLAQGTGESINLEESLELGLTKLKEYIIKNMNKYK